MSLQGYHKWIDKCNNGLKVQHAYHQWSIGSTQCGFIQPWYGLHILEYFVKLEVHQTVIYFGVWQVVSEAEEGLPKRVHGEHPPMLFPDRICTV